jgi:hypothetical protein
VRDELRGYSEEVEGRAAEAAEGRARAGRLDLTSTLFDPTLTD